MYECKKVFKPPEGNFNLTKSLAVLKEGDFFFSIKNTFIKKLKKK